jgi:hypothetical protein
LPGAVRDELRMLERQMGKPGTFGSGGGVSF